MGDFSILLDYLFAPKYKQSGIYLHILTQKLYYWNTIYLSACLVQSEITLEITF